MKVFKRYLWMLAAIFISFQGCAGSTGVDDPKEDETITETTPTPTSKANQADVSEVKNVMNIIVRPNIICGTLGLLIIMESFTWFI